MSALYTSYINKQIIIVTAYKDKANLGVLATQSHLSIMKKLSFKTELILFQSDLYRYALKLTSNNWEADDLVQETSLKALDNEDKYTPGTNLKGWLYTIMYNLFINNYRRVMREQAHVDETNSNHSALHESDNSEGIYDIKEIRHIINSLAKEQRDTFSLHISGFKYREIADKLNMPIGTVKSKIHVTRQKLQTELRDFR